MSNGFFHRVAFFERYGEWPEERIAIPDPNAPAPQRETLTRPKRETLTRPSTCRTSKGVLPVIVLAEGDALELERGGLGL